MLMHYADSVDMSANSATTVKIFHSYIYLIIVREVKLTI